MRPKALDTTSSPYTVYERRNITEDVIEQRAPNDTVKTLKCYRYDEREMSMDEYERQQAELDAPTTQMIMQTLSEIDLKIEMQNAGV
ncbi:MAG: hypothetical protein RR361_04635 [Anaerovorax sp.]